MVQPPRSSFSASRLDHIACSPYCSRRCIISSKAKQCCAKRLPTSFWMARQYDTASLARRRLGDGRLVQHYLRRVVYERPGRSGVKPARAGGSSRHDDKHGIVLPFARRHARRFASSFGMAFSSPCSSNSSPTPQPQSEGRVSSWPTRPRRVRCQYSCANGAYDIRLASPGLTTAASWLLHIHSGAVHLACKQQPTGAAAACRSAEPCARAARCSQ